MKWTKQRIIQQLRAVHRGGILFSYAQLAKRNQSLLSAAVYHFGTYRSAITHAGLEYRTQRPRWSKQQIITLIKKAKRKGDDVHWSAVIKRKDELRQAAYASLQPRLFRSWDRALHAAGLDADDVAKYRTWDRTLVIFELRARAREQEPLNSGAVQAEDSGLHAAAIRNFGSFDAAIRAARIDPAKHRIRRRWNREEILKSLKKLATKNSATKNKTAKADLASLHAAAKRMFGTVAAAKRAAKR